MEDRFLMMLNFHSISKGMEEMACSDGLGSDFQHRFECIWNEFVDIQNDYFDFVVEKTSIGENGYIEKEAKEIAIRV